jgi:flagellar hook-associated protein 2
MVMRIGGLASGMDIDTLVGDLMRAERIPLNKLAQQKTMLEWKRDDYRSMNKLLDELDRFILEGVALQGTFNKKTVTSTNPSAVTATVAGTASNITSRIKVTQLATASNWVSNNAVTNVSDGSFVSNTAKLKDINGGATFGTVAFDLKVKAQKPGSTSYDAVKTISIDPNVDTLESVAKKFTDAGLNMSAFYDNSTGKFVISNNLTGAGSKLSLEDATTVDFFNKLGFTGATGAGPMDLAETTSGVNAKFDLNGLTGLERTSNDFTISGISYSLKAVTTTDVVISSSTDTDGLVDSIKGFVDKYNETIEAINQKISEEKYRDFKPLTDEQRKDLSEKEAELWDEKAKSGMLRGDSILSGALGAMRLDLYGTVNTGDTKYDQLAEIGIKTSSNYMDKGKLVLDETKLREALAANPDAVMNMFTLSSDSKNTADMGIAKRLRETIENTEEKIELKAGNAMRTNGQFTLGRQLLDVDKRISSFEDRMVQVENRYWRQFSAMEQAIQRSNQQMGYLMQQFGGGQ